MRQELHYSNYIGAPARAISILSPLCERYRANGQRELLGSLLRCRYLLGSLHADLEQPTLAVPVFAEISKRIPSDDSQHQILSSLAGGYRYLYESAYKQALEDFARARAALPVTTDSWWLEKDIGDALLGLGSAHLGLGQPELARASLAQARTIFVRLVNISYNAEYRRRLVQAHRLADQAGVPPPAEVKTRTNSRE